MIAAMRSKAARFQATFRGLLPAACLRRANHHSCIWSAVSHTIARTSSLCEAADAPRCVSAIAYLFAMGQKKKRHGAVIALQAARVRPQRKKKKKSTPTRAAGAGSSTCKGVTRTVTARRRAATHYVAACKDDTAAPPHDPRSLSMSVRDSRRWTTRPLG